MENQQQFQAEVQRVSSKVEDELISPIQGYAYKNASTCYFSRLKGRDRNACVQAALNPASQAGEYVQSEFDELSNRVNRCAQTCQDDIYGFSTKQSPEMKAQMDECTKNCMLKASRFLPEMFERIQKNLAPLQPPASEFTKGTLLEGGGLAGSSPQGVSGLAPAQLAGLVQGGSGGLASGLVPGLPGGIPGLGDLGSLGSGPEKGS